MSDDLYDAQMSAELAEQDFRETQETFDLTLHYFTSDDGIYLMCACSWEHNLGWDPSIGDAVEAAKKHRLKCQEKG